MQDSAVDGQKLVTSQKHNSEHMYLSIMINSVMILFITNSE